jgi:AcrR family transcriptional regulator
MVVTPVWVSVTLPGTMLSEQVVFLQEEALATGAGLRSRKRIKTRRAIEDAALALFEKQGYEATTVEEIAERAEVSTTTFFRYFPTKAEVVLGEHGEHLPALHAAILARPPEESDLDAVRRAVQTAWVGAIDAERTARKAQIIASSDVLTGVGFQRGHRWLAVITDALAERRGLESADERASLAARVVLGVLGAGVEEWIADGCIGELADSIEDRFNLAIELCVQWSTPEG